MSKIKYIDINCSLDPLYLDQINLSHEETIDINKEIAVKQLAHEILYGGFAAIKFQEYENNNRHIYQWTVGVETDEQPLKDYQEIFNKAYNKSLDNCLNEIDYLLSTYNTDIYEEYYDRLRVIEDLEIIRKDIASKRLTEAS